MCSGRRPRLTNGNVRTPPIRVTSLTGDENEAMSEPLASNVFETIEKLVDATASVGGDVKLPRDILDHFRRAGLEEDELAAIIGADDAHLGRYDDLSPDQTDRAVRLNRIMSLGAKIFGNSQKTFFWLRTPNKSLGSRTPIAALERETGAKLVESALLRIEHGIYA